MIYLKCVMSAITALFCSLLTVAILGPFKGVGEQRAIGLAALTVGVAETRSYKRSCSGFWPFLFLLWPLE